MRRPVSSIKLPLPDQDPVQTRALARRFWLPLAVSTAAAVSLASCGLGVSGDESRLAPTPLPPAPPSATAAPATTKAAETSALSPEMQQVAERLNAALAAQNKAKAAAPAAEEKSHKAAAEAVIPAEKPAHAESPVVLANQTHQAEPEPAAEAAHHAPAAETAKPPEAHAAPAAAPAATPLATEIHAPAEAHAPAAHAAEAHAPEAAHPTPTQIATVAPPKPAPAPLPASISPPTGDVASHGTAAMASMTAVSPPPEAPTATQPTVTEIPTDTLLNALRQRAQSHPQMVNYALALQLLESAETGKPADASSLAGLAPADQKLVTDLATALQTLTARPISGNMTLAERAAPVLEAAKSWQADADLSLPKLVLASRVDSYGVYTPIEPVFENGKRQVVIIYCEVANFTAQKSEDGWYQTKLSQQDTLMTEDGLLVWRPNAEEVEDRSRNQRRDFYLVKKLTIPDNLAIGKYTLRMSVTDKLSNKVSMISMPIEIVAPK